MFLTILKGYLIVGLLTYILCIIASSERFRDRSEDLKIVVFAVVCFPYIVIERVFKKIGDAWVLSNFNKRR